MYKLEKSSIPLYIQLYEQIKSDIQNNNIAGTKLLSIRKMCQEYKLSKTTVESAYNQLYAEGYIESRPQSGFYVSEDIYKEFKQKNINTSKEKISEKKYKYNFSPAQYSDDVFPKKIWTKLHNKVITNTNLGLYPKKQGDLQLRKEIKTYLASSRAVFCDEEQIIVCSGFSDSMFILASILKDFTSFISIENPGYKVTPKVFKQFGYKINPVSITKQGIDLKELEESKSKLVYVTPSHQYPTGVTIPISKRIKLINWAIENNSYIIEDDYDSELSYNNRPIPSLQGINNNERVIYSGTFSKALSPALRISYLVLPKKLLEKYKNTFDFSFSGVPIDIQKTLEAFIKEGYWDKHIRKMRALNKKKHDLMKKAISIYLKDTVKILREGSGLAILIKPTVKIDWKKLEKLLEENSIKVYSIQFDTSLKEDIINLGFGCFKEEEIFLALESFSKIWFNAIIK